jgi:hypothetical protein
MPALSLTYGRDVGRSAPWLLECMECSSTAGEAARRTARTAHATPAGLGRNGLDEDRVDEDRVGDLGGDVY